MYGNTTAKEKIKKRNHTPQTPNIMPEASAKSCVD
jgi:hypothetical protein